MLWNMHKYARETRQFAQELKCETKLASVNPLSQAQATTENQVKLQRGTSRCSTSYGYY